MPFEAEEVLKTFTILVDTREQPSARAEKRYNQFSAPYARQKLDYGDYSAQILINDEPVIIKAAIERKMSLEELSGCLTHDRDRFRNEMLRAKADDASLYLLIENATWEKILAGHYKTQFHPNAYFGTLVSWIARYDLKPIFCREEISGKLIDKILYKEAKIRLERGDYG